MPSRKKPRKPPSLARRGPVEAPSSGGGPDRSGGRASGPSRRSRAGRAAAGAHGARGPEAETPIAEEPPAEEAEPEVSAEAEEPEAPEGRRRSSTRRSRSRRAGGRHRAPQARAGRQRAVSPGRRFQARIERQRTLPSVLELQERVHATEGRCAPIIVTRMEPVDPDLSEDLPSLLPRRRHVGRSNQPFARTRCCGNDRSGGRGGGPVSSRQRDACGQARTFRG
jgi:hypothetical protein